MPFNLRKAAAEDAEAACEVLRRSILECCLEDHRNDPAILEAWLSNKTPGNVRSWFSSAGYAIVAEQEGRIVGVAMLSASGPIALNYLTPGARFQGIGRAMLRALETEAAARGITDLALTSTATAHEFYRRNGYADTGETSSAFGLTAHKMTKPLTGPAPFDADPLRKTPPR
jgi:GNAT superfamily N-acetyltransferase